jgi:hypothetical protein
MRYLKVYVAALLIGSSAADVAAMAKAPAVTPVTARPNTAVTALPKTAETAQLRQAFRFAFPIYEVMRTRAFQLGRARAAGIPNAVNFILPRLTLADADSREVTTPNNDTLYGSAWLDLAAGPVILNVPALVGRYHSVALMALTSDNTAILGTRTGGQGGRYAIVGPDYTGAAPDGTLLIRSATNDAWLLIRVLVNGPSDIDAAAKALGRFGIDLPEDRGLPVPTAAPAPPTPSAAVFIAAVNEALARSAAAPARGARAAAYAGSGIGSGIAWASLTPGQQALWTRSLPALMAELKSGLVAAGTMVGGWSYPHDAIGAYGDDNDLRAYVALGGLGALPRTEALYLTANTDAAGAPLTGGNQGYTVTLPPRLPVGAFWSLSMYQVEADGRLFFVPNALNRFTIGDRSPQMRPNRDGSIDIFVQPKAPSGERIVNWLPAPKGRFTLVFRAYLPKPELLDGSFRLPPVAATTAIE